MYLKEISLIFKNLKLLLIEILMKLIIKLLIKLNKVNN